MRKLASASASALALAAIMLSSGVVARSHRSHRTSHSYLEPASTSAAYYRAAGGDLVHRPVQASTAPAGASAKCYDGTYSFSESRRGTCSHHGGVARWL